MSSTLHAEGATRGYRTSELQRYLALSPALLGGVIALLGLILAGGGAYLAWLGGSLYYVLVGAMLVAAGYLLFKGRIAGFYTYVGAFAFTAAWSFWEVGLSGLQLIPRLVGPFVLLILAILVAPLLDQTTGRGARKWGLVSAGIFVAALAILIPIFNRQAAPLQLPDARADAFFADPGYAPTKGEWNAYMAAARARSGIRISPKSRPQTSKISSVSGPSTRATFRRSTDQ